MSGKTGVKRVFLAIELSDHARGVCSHHIERLRRECPDARIGWERKEKLHITLKFLGPTSDAMLMKLNKRLGHNVPPLVRGVLRLSGPGVFPNMNRPRILWIGVDDLNSCAARAHAAVEEVCSSLGFAPEDKTFTPHITIGRVRDPRTARSAVAAHLEAQIEPVEFQADGLVIYESRLLPTGSVYSAVSRLASR